MRKYLKRRKDIAIVENDTTEFFDNVDSNTFDEEIEDLIEKNREKVEEIRNIKIEQESQVMMLCEVTKQKKRELLKISHDRR